MGGGASSDEKKPTPPPPAVKPKTPPKPTSATGAGGGVKPPAPPAPGSPGGFQRGGAGGVNRMGQQQQQQQQNGFGAFGQSEFGESLANRDMLDDDEDQKGRTGTFRMQQTRPNAGVVGRNATMINARDQALGISTMSTVTKSPQAGSISPQAGDIDPFDSSVLERKASTAFQSAKARARAVAKDSSTLGVDGPLSRRNSDMGALNRTPSQHQLHAALDSNSKISSSTAAGAVKTVNGTPKIKQLIETMNKFRSQFRKMREVSDSDISEMRLQQEQYAQLKLGMAQQIAALGEHVDVVGRPNRVAFYDTLESIMAEGEAKEGTVPLLRVCLVHLTQLDWAADFICGQAGGRNMLIRCAQEGWFQFMELLLTMPNLTVVTAADMKEVLRQREAEMAAAKQQESSSDDDFLADVDDDETVQQIDSVGDFMDIDDGALGKNKKSTKMAASPSPGRGASNSDPPFVDPVELLRVCVSHTTARIPLCGTLCKHWSQLRFVEYSRQMLPLWKELVVGLCSPSRSSKGAHRREGEDRAQRLGMLQRILGLQSAIPININEIDTGDNEDDNSNIIAGGDASPGDNNSLVSRSIIEGETAVFQTLTRKSQDVNWAVILPDGHSLLTLACACSQKAIVELLLQQPLVDVSYDAPGNGSALDIVKMNGGNAQITALLEAKLNQMEEVRLAAENEKLRAQQDSHVDSLRKRLQGKKRVARLAAPPKWIEESEPTGPPGFDPDKEVDDWAQDRDSKPEVLTGPVLDVCNTLREHWELIKNKAGASAADVLSGSKIGGNPVVAEEEEEEAAPITPVDVPLSASGEEEKKEEDGAPAAEGNGDDEIKLDESDVGASDTATATATAAVTTPIAASTNNLEDEAYLLDGTTLRQDLCNTLLGLGTRIIVEGKDPKEKVLQCVTRLLSEGSNVPLSVKLARIFMFRIATVDFAPQLSGTSKWALRAAQRGDLEALDTLLKVDKLWREEHEVVEIVMCCVRYSADPTSAWTKIALCLILLRHQKQLRFGTYKDHLRPLWEELIDSLTNPQKINMNELVAEQKQLAIDIAVAEDPAAVDYHGDGYKRQWDKKAPESALRFELICRIFSNPNFYQLRHDVELTQGISWFSRACRLGDVDFIRACIMYAVGDINRVYSNKSTPLMQAIVGNQMDAVQELCRCSDIDLFVEGPGGITAVDLARQMKRDAEMIDVIVAAGEKQSQEVAEATA